MPMSNQSQVSGGAGTVNFGLPPVGTSAADTTAQLQAAINATPEFGTLVLPLGELQINATLVVPKSMSIRGAGAYALVGAWADNGQFDSPGQAPYLAGSTIAMQTAGLDCIQLTGSATSNPLSDFGIRFDGGRWTNTGHGIVAKASRAYLGGSEHGMFHTKWTNIHVFGHDGNHYAFKLVNFLNSHFDQLRSYGGGGLWLECDSYAGNYGNSVFTNPIMHQFVSGSSDCYTLKARTASAAQGVLNLLTFVRPQSLQSDATAKFGVSASASQYLFRATVGGISPNAVSIIGPDFETTLGGQCDFGAGTIFVDPSGIFGEAGDTTSRQFPIFRSTAGSKKFYSDLTTRNVNAPGSTIATIAASGTGATVSISGDDETGTITLNTGTGTWAAGIFQVTLGRPASGVSCVVLSPRNANAAACGWYVAGKTSGSYVINAANVPATSSQLVWDYRVTY